MNTFRNRRKRLGRQRWGATAVEFAVVAPAFVMVMVVCVEFARMSTLRNLSHNAAYEATRFVLAEGATIQDAIDRANTVLGRVGNVQASVLINGSDGSADDDGNVAGQLDFQTQTVTTRIEIKLSENTLVLPGSMFGENTIISQLTMRTERYRGFFDGNGGN